MNIIKDKSFWKLLCATVFIQLFVLAFIWMSGYSFTIWGDQTEEVIQLYTHFYRTFRSSNLTLWQPYVGLGASTTVHFYTVFTAISSWLFLLLPNETLIPYFIPFVNIIRSIIMLALAYYYFKRLFKINSIGGNVGALLFAFNSFSLFFAHFPYFADFMIPVLLLMIGSEKILSGESPFLFIFSITLSSVMNLYSIYMNCWFLFIYFTFRLFMKETQLSLKIYFILFIRVFFYILIGLGLSALVFLPNIQSVLNNNRLGGGNFHWFATWKDIFARLSMLISPITSDFDYNCYINALGEGLNSPIPYFYVSILFVYCFFLLAKSNHPYRKVLLSTLALIFIPTLFLIFNYIFNGFNNIRWAYFFTVFEIILIAFTLNHQWSKIELKRALLKSICYVITIALISYFFHLYSQRNSINMIVNTFVMLILLLFVYISLNNTYKHLFALTLCLELTYAFAFRYVTFAGFEPENKYQFNQIMQTINKNSAVEQVKIEEDNDEFYRIDVQKNDFTNYNDAIMNQYSGFNSYLSVTNFYASQYIYRHFSMNHFINSDGTKTLAKEIAGMRYALNYGKTVIGDDLVPFNAPECNAYKVNDPVNLGFALTNTLDSDYTATLPSFYQDYLSQYYIIKENGDKLINQQYILENMPISQNNNLLALDPTKEKYIVIDYSLTKPHCNVILEFYDDTGNSIQYVEVNEYSYTIQPIPSQAKTVYVYCHNEYNKNEFINCSAFILSNYALDKGSFVAEFKTNHNHTDVIIGDIEIPEDSYVHTIIAYDPNWKVYDNGQQLPKFKSNNGFVGFQLNTGTHHIEIRFEPNYILPATITIISFTIIIGIYFKRKQNQA